jgi:hypothetical protein
MRCHSLTVAVLSAVVILVADPAAAAPRNFSPALAPVLEASRDYVLVEQASAKALAKSITDGGCNPCWGQVVRYTTFSSPVQTYDAYRYDGRDVVLLVPVNHARTARATPERIRTLVDRLDLIHATYRELLGWEPTRSRDPLGKQIAAILPNDRNDWYGLAFVPGDSSEYVNAVLDEDSFDDDLLGNVFVHELAHNFDPIRHWDFGPDAAHDWTTFMQVWTARRLARMDEGGRSRWDREEANQTTRRWSLWQSDPARYTFARCAVASPRPQDCQDNVNTITGVLMATMARHVDSPATVRQWLRTVRTDATRPDTPEARSEYLLRTLADATRTDTRCVATHFRFPNGAGLAGASQYATPFPGCVDGDNDGFRRFDDCDDTRASVRPGAPEITDGLDNDCNDVVDERPVREADLGDFNDSGFSGTPVGAIPLAAEGTLATSADRDSITFTPALPVSRARVRLCATGDRMSLAGLTPEGVLWGPLATAEAGSCTTMGTNNRSYRGFRVDRAGVSAGTASWRLEIATSSEGWPRPRAITLVGDGSNSVRATVDAARVPGGTSGVEVRWTGSGAGLLKSGPLTDANSLVAPALPPASMDRATSERHQLRAQLFRDGLPIEEPSRPFTVATEGFALSSGVSVSSALPAGRNEERWYIDVPANATRLTIASTSAQNIDLHTARVAAPIPMVAIPSINAAPARNLAQASATTSSGNETLIVNAPAAGRWYVTPTNSAAQSATYTLRAAVEATPPAIRAGGYFNPSRPGHGLFVHPAGGEWAGLWYTYEANGQPIWYYLQGSAPGANGQWNGIIYRARWDGAAAQLRPIGNAVLTPDVENGFSFSWNLDGLAGSEAFRPFGRGCPTLGGGAAVNASQHYFDAARAGSGYSVQLMTSPAAYEFYAAFVYDNAGQPRFLTAERSGAGARDETLALQQINGFCPSCVHAATARRSAGTLRRVYSSTGVLERITLDAAFGSGLSGDWDVTDTVQMLDGSRRAQGCAP